MPRSVLPLCCAALLTLTATICGAPTPSARLKLERSTLEMTTLNEEFDAPYNLVWGPDGFLWCTQLEGTLWRIDPQTGVRTEMLRLAGVFQRKSHGLLSFVFHPHFQTTPFLYLHYVYQLPSNGSDEIVRSRIVRCRWDGAQFGPPETILDALPGRSFHNGSRLKIGSDEKLYISAGDAGDAASAQDPAKRSGKLLRLNLDGSIPSDNPNSGSPVWSLGHRNVQGLAFAPGGRLYASDHGANNDDEVNLITRGHNYGWPTIEGFTDLPNERDLAEGKNFTAPLRAWTPTIAAAGLAFYAHDAIPEWRNALLLASLKGRALRVLELNAAGDEIVRERIFLQERLGRIRDVCVSPDGDVYLLTSNSDWHPRLQGWMYKSLPSGPDRIVRLRSVADTTLDASGTSLPIWKEDLEPLSLMVEDNLLLPTSQKLSAGERLYLTHCAACHRPDGLGAPGLIPPLTDPAWVDKNKNRLIQVTLAGLSGRISVLGESYDQEMPAFRNLPDEDLAAILSYVRSSFGNKAGGVVAEEIREERRSMR